MSEDKNATTPEPEAQKGEVPQGVADELNALAADLRRHQQAADRAWKVAALVSALLLLVIAGYLFLGIYNRFVKQVAEPENLTQMVINVGDEALQRQGYPSLEDPDFAAKVGAMLSERAPEIMQQRVRPKVEQMLADLPQHRMDLTKKIQAQAPQLVDEAVERIQTEWLPQAAEGMKARLVEVVGQILEQQHQDIDRLISGVLAQHAQNMEALAADDPQQLARLRSAMEATFEQDMGYLMDAVFEAIDAGLASTQDGLEDLVARHKHGNLTKEQQLEVDLIRLVYALFEQKGLEPEESLEGVLDRLSEALRAPTVDIAPAPRRPARPEPVAREQDIKTTLNDINKALQDPQVPDEAKAFLRHQAAMLQEQVATGERGPKEKMEMLQKAIDDPETPQMAKEALRAQLETLKAERIEALKQTIQNLEDTLKNEDIPPMGKSMIEKQLEDAKQELQKLQ